MSSTCPPRRRPRWWLGCSGCTGMIGRGWRRSSGMERPYPGLPTIGGRLPSGSAAIGRRSKRITPLRHRLSATACSDPDGPSMHPPLQRRRNCHKQDARSCRRRFDDRDRLGFFPVHHPRPIAARASGEVCEDVRKPPSERRPDQHPGIERTRPCRQPGKGRSESRDDAGHDSDGWDAASPPRRDVACARPIKTTCPPCAPRGAGPLSRKEQWRKRC
ncbi:hypothetical protein JAN5088_00621 [Jannaschia rubra]|uniref:Uncharacterized protein n=1 Tax=Jannaschia rubra TaxID=282197 RepID=A0A0M6XMH9_9RHOB|nr:hypothetical protein JAN5088_00621 [Jannaschia rubra]SFG51963.1 hypothetical protein SAMN04488517_1062 [Jannaschia rubra]